MASFQVHEDQENAITRNVRNLRSSKPTATTNNGRSVLGLINNNSRLPVRQTKNVGENKAKNGSTVFSVCHDPVVTDDTSKAVVAKSKSAAFTICQDEKKIIVTEKRKTFVSNSITSNREISSTSNYSLVTNDIKTAADKELDISTGIAISVNECRQPLKDLKTVNEEEPMSEGSFIETCDASPMVVDRSLTLTITPSSQVKPPKQKDVSLVLCDMEEYREDIFNYLRKAELRHRPKANYMLRQPDVTYSMRTVLVDWLVEVAEEYKLHTETLYLTVSFIDRFLSVMSVVRNKLQLLGTAAMFIASKYEEIYPPEVTEFVYITDETYNKKQMLRMEHLILKVLKFDISVPTVLAFLTHIKVECDLPEKNLHLAMYLCELSLLEGDPYIQYIPSLIACAAIAAARHCLEYKDVWSDELYSVTGYTLDDLSPCIHHFNETHRKANSLQQQAICEKYKANKWHNVSEIPHRDMTVTLADSDS